MKFLILFLTLLFVQYNTIAQKPQLTPNKFKSIERFEAIKVSQGKILFQHKCASCHHINKELTGPPLYKVRTRIPAGIIYAYLKNPDSIIFKKDRYFKNLRTKYPTKHVTFPSITEVQVKSILEYIDNNNSVAESPSVIAVFKKTDLKSESPEAWRKG